MALTPVPTGASGSLRTQAATIAFDRDTRADQTANVTGAAAPSPG